MLRQPVRDRDPARAARRLAVCARPQRRAHSFDEYRRLRPKGDRHRWPLPDGVFVDVDAGHIYWTNMGVPNDQVVMSRTPGSFKTVLLPRVSSKPEWLAR